MNRFQEKKNYFRVIRKGIPGILTLGVFVCFLAGLDSVSRGTQEQQKRSLETAIWRNVVHCYALEGKYPESLDYIEENYGLSYDRDKYFVDYEIVGSNMMPEVTVIRRGLEGPE